MAKTLGLEGAVGLSTVLSGQIDVADAIQVWGTNAEVDVIASGEIPPNPSELLGSEAMRRLLSWAEERYDVVLLDAPPLQPVTDPTILATLCSGVIVVTRVDGYTHRDQPREALDNLRNAEARLLGLVLTRMPLKRGRYYYYSYASEPTSCRRARHVDARAFQSEEDNQPNLTGSRQR